MAVDEGNARSKSSNTSFLSTTSKDHGGQSSSKPPSLPPGQTEFVKTSAKAGKSATDCAETSQVVEQIDFNPVMSATLEDYVSAFRELKVQSA